MATKRPLLLTILDGWGYRPQVEGNAIAAARKPHYDALLRQYPNTLISTSGPAVGLPDGQMGNSEVGHLNIGAGRVVLMDVTRIDHLIATGELKNNAALRACLEHARTHRLHLMGLLSDGGVHSHQTHLYALMRLAREAGVRDVYVHCFLDGRDTPPESGIGHVDALRREMEQVGVGQIASLSGRYYAMDRDQRWERIERAFGAMVLGNGEKATNPGEAVRRSYEHGVTDEFVEPVTITGPGGEPVGLIREEDACLFFNYRADRAREMTRALTDSSLPQPPRAQVPQRLRFTTMTQYEKSQTLPYILPPEHLDNLLANVMAQANLRNLRVAETEKYAHVTYFFNGGAEKPYGGEEREMVASPKVATYDLKPEMSAAGVTSVVTKALERGEFDVIVMNFANADMVGHSGKMDPTVRAVETVDSCLGEIHAALKRQGGRWIITADHGNAETMVDPVTGGPHTYHTTNPVPLILLQEGHTVLRSGGALEDIAPTILAVMGLEKPRDMAGRDLRL